MSLQDCICPRSLWLSPHQLTKPHVLSYAVVIYSSHLWSSSLAICAGRLAAYQDIIVDDDPDLPLPVKHYSHVHEKNQVDFCNSSLSQSCGFGSILLPVLSKPPLNSEACCCIGVFQSPGKHIYLLNLILFLCSFLAAVGKLLLT